MAVVRASPSPRCPCRTSIPQRRPGPPSVSVGPIGDCPQAPIGLTDTVAHTAAARSLSTTRGCVRSRRQQEVHRRGADPCLRDHAHLAGQRGRHHDRRADRERRRRDRGGGWPWGSCSTRAWSLALACVFWFVPLPAIISEWKLTIDGKGPAANTALDHVTWVLQQRSTPLKSVTPRELKVPGQPSRRLPADPRGPVHRLRLLLRLRRRPLHRLDVLDLHVAGALVLARAQPDLAELPPARLGPVRDAALRRGPGHAARRCTAPFAKASTWPPGGSSPAGQGTVGNFIATRPDPMNLG